MSTDFVPRVLLTKSFIDSHDRAIKTIALALRDAGFEVILIDYEMPSDVAHVAVDEDVDVIGVSFMSGGQVSVTEAIVGSLAQANRGDIPVVVGGTIRPFDVEGLNSAGVRAIFRGGESFERVIETFRALALSTRAERNAAA
ncbi:cobalamin B12-binding domain-containing protein [Conexibacter sp. DBS9H8]|uniref:cobalamin B12-binding domain-containing protein n=1 Tax=Conexibacter sp. DBS9H8 TaxID=2937801 RepID=UPI00200DF8C8|nr:cobalamin-dependent protein [Conexibacter sp. DBS9H8]